MTAITSGLTPSFGEVASSRPFEALEVGVDSAFGVLARPDGRLVLCEAQLFFAGEAVTVCLATGRRRVEAADGRSSWKPLRPAKACAAAGLPAPAVDGGSEVARRLDPFHVERHRSGLFCALIDLIDGRSLPCGHALRLLADGQPWDGRFTRQRFDTPAITAAQVAEHLARGVPLTEAVRHEILGDADLLDAAPDRQHALLATSGWNAALADLPSRVAARHRALHARFPIAPGLAARIAAHDPRAPARRKKPRMTSPVPLASAGTP